MPALTARSTEVQVQKLVREPSGFGQLPSSSPIHRELKRSLIAQMRRLAQHADARLVGVWGMLVALDLFFIAVFCFYWIYPAPSLETGSPVASGWRIGKDWSYAETLGYLKLGIVFAALAGIPNRRERPIYPVLALIFAGALLDDALLVHERLGDGIASWLALRRSIFGELMVWVIYGVALVPLLRIALGRSPQEDRSNGRLFVGAVAVLALFAVAADFAHVVVRYWVQSSIVDAGFTVIEDGGEQIILSMIFGLTILVCRELRGRQARSFLSLDG